MQGRPPRIRYAGDTAQQVGAISWMVILCDTRWEFCQQLLPGLLEEQFDVVFVDERQTEAAHTLAFATQLAHGDGQPLDAGDQEQLNVKAFNASLAYVQGSLEQDFRMGIL